MENSKKIKTKKKKMALWKKFLIGFLAVLLIGIAIGTGYFFSLYSKMEKVEIDKTDLGITPKEEYSEYDNVDKIKNIALFGIDSEDGGVGRSDSIMIATLDPVHKKLKLTSIMRDSYVEIPGRSGKDKINHAYAFGGPSLAIKTLNQNFGLNIEDFVAVNFTSMPDIVNILGGVDINITAEEIPHIPGIKNAGINHLTGEQALAYSRIRYASGGDYKRTERHRTVMNAVFNKLMNTSPSSYPSIVSQLLPHVKTSLSASQILSLGTDVLNIGSKTLEQERYPLDGYCNGIKVNSIYYLDFNRETTTKQIRDYIFNDIK